MEFCSLVDLVPFVDISFTLITTVPFTSFKLLRTHQICSNYEFAFNIKCKYNGLSRDHNHLSGLTGFLNKQSMNQVDCTVFNIYL